MSSHDSGIDPATQKVLAGIADPELAARYPDRTHFIAVDHPRQGEMATRALFSGDPVVLVYADGRELLMTPERVVGMAALFLLVAALFMRLRRRKDGDAVQLPPGAHIEARDSAGLPVAA